MLSLCVGVELPWWLSGKESACQCRRARFCPWVKKIPWRREWQPTPVFLPGESHGQRSLEGYSRPWGHKESDTIEQLIYTHMPRCGIARSQASSIYSSLRNLHTILHSGCTNIGVFPFFSSPSPAFIYRRFDDGHSGQC